MTGLGLSEVPIVPLEDSLESIIARVNFFESSVDQIKKEFPKYLQQLSDTEKSHSSMGKVMRSVASTESNSVLQYITFLYAEKEEMLAREQAKYKETIEEVKKMLEDCSKLIIAPIREVLNDHTTYVKAHEKREPAKPAPVPTPTPAPIPDPDPASSLSDIDKLKLSALSNINQKSFLPVHIKFFEKYRLKEMKRLLKVMVEKEVMYHSKALEAYAQLLECIADAQERDKQMPAYS